MPIKPLLSSLLIASLLVTGCTKEETSGTKVHISWTTHGVPYVEAKDYYGLGYGVAHAHVEHGLCTMALRSLTVRGELARFFGPGENNSHILSDIGYKAIDHQARALHLLPKISDDARALMDGYIDGYNKALAELTPEDYPSPCRGAEWVTPLNAEILMASYLDMATLASTRAFMPAIAAAQPPQLDQQSSRGKYPLFAHLEPESILKTRGIGSNGWALGPDRVKDSNGLLLGNPHFPWDGGSRFYEIHLKIPGELEVHGVNMIGIPVVTIGFNQHLGWTHTVSQAKRFTFYQLELDPDNPLRYKYDGEYRDIRREAVEIEVLTEEGTLEAYQGDVYFSHFGPIVDLSSLEESFAWTGQSAITLRDANINNYRMLDQWLAMNKAASTEELKQALARIQGLPWVNTVMIDKDGNASYIDASVTPQLSPISEQYWRMASRAPEFANLWLDGAGQVLLPGNSSEHEWLDSGDTRDPGIMPFQKAPQVTRSDYVFNANSSHWLSHVQEPLEGYSIIYGPERTVRSPRTRYNAQLITEPDRFELTAADRRFDMRTLKEVLYQDGSLFGDGFRQQLAERCSRQHQVMINGTLENIADACTVISNWDGKYNLDSRGAIVMREFLQEFRIGAHRDLRDSLFSVPFDPQDAARTPRDLAPAPADASQDPVLVALYRAATRLRDNGIALDAALGDVQIVQKSRNPHHIFPIHGGQSFEGIFNMVSKSSASDSPIGTIVTGKRIRGSADLDWLDNGPRPGAAYRLNYGTSFVLALSYDEDGPRAETILTYGQSHDPESEFFADQMEMFSRKEWRSMPLTAADIEAATIRKVELELP